MRLSYPTNVKIVKVPCTGRVDVILMLKAFESGVDGVYLAGCLEGECHFLRGNLRAKKRVGYVKALLEEVGCVTGWWGVVGGGGGRVEMYNMSSAQGQRFAEVAREMTEKIRALGPNPIRLRNAERGMRNEKSAIRNPQSEI
jgi:coenzyme F420-reducing hydrogenase delta subunit